MAMDVQILQQMKLQSEARFSQLRRDLIPLTKIPILTKDFWTNMSMHISKN